MDREIIKIFISGATGKMGVALTQLISEKPEFKLATIENCDVVIDFSHASAAQKLLETAATHRKPVIMGTTGHSEEQKMFFKKIATEIPFLVSPNMSVGVNLLWKLAETASQTLGNEFNVSIREKHHIHKKDSPSGTAKRLQEIVQKLRNTLPPVEAIREGEVLGEHTIIFESKGEKIQITHEAATRGIFAEGALKAAQWIIGKPAGFYTMENVLS